MKCIKIKKWRSVKFQKSTDLDPEEHGLARCIKMRLNSWKEKEEGRLQAN